ncbi:hypothetical protein MKEN_00308300 [Mycena kentingensis (nom. inval.)]|nr:hypothetical protein MKEN_00308300 [Mycena kentingensis (nom. inval.)]
MAPGLAPSALPRTTSPPTPELSIIGPVELGVLMAFILFGLTSSQSYTYYSRFPNDSRKLKVFVAFVWICEAIHVGAIGNYLWETTVVHFEEPEIALVDVPTSMLVSFLVNGVTTGLIEAFFGLRIYRVSKGGYKLIPCIIWLLAFAQLIIPVVPVFTGSSGNPSLIDFVSEQTWAVYSSMALAAACDFLIVVGLVYFLWQARSDSQRRTIVIVDKLIAWTIETGLITSTAAALELILFAINAVDWRWLTVDCILAGLYSNTLLANLNSRAVLRALDLRDSPTELIAIPLGHPRPRTRKSELEFRPPTTNANSIVTWEDSNTAGSASALDFSSSNGSGSKPAVVGGVVD